MSTATVPMAQIICYKCGIPFWVPASWINDRLADRKNFWCPNGDVQHYTGKTEQEKENERLRREIDGLRHSYADAREELTSRRYDLTPKQQQERDWLMDYVKGAGWERANAIIKAFGRVSAFANATAAEVNQEVQDTTIGESLAEILLERTREALRLYPIQKLIPAKASEGN